MKVEIIEGRKKKEGRLKEEDNEGIEIRKERRKEGRNMGLKEGEKIKQEER